MTEVDSAKGQLLVKSARIQDDQINRYLALFVFIASSIVYMMTVAPTFSFWDCGEFVACSYTLGIAHPPGSPLFLLIGRLFSVLPIGDDIGWRINLISVFTSAGCATLGYLILQRIIVRWYHAGLDFVSRVSMYGGSVIGGLLLAYGRTFWASAVEAEVYGLAMLMTFAVFWLGLLSYDATSPKRRTAYLILGVYVMTLGLGVHMTVFLAAPALVFFLAVRRSLPGFNWLFFAAFVGVELYLIMALSAKPGEISHALPLALIALVMFFHLFSLEKPPKLGLITVSILSFVAMPVIPVMMEVVGGAESLNSLAFLSSSGFAWVSLAALGMFSALLLFWFIKDRTSKAQRIREGLILSLGYLGCALVMLLATEFLSGYKTFIVVSIPLSVALWFVLREHFDTLTLIAGAGVSLAILGFWQFALGISGAISVVALIDFLKQREMKQSARIVIGTALIAACALLFYLTGWHKTHPGPLTVALGAVALITLALRFKSGSESFRLAALALVIAGIGFSVNAFVPIRSGQSPLIDQNDPSRSTAAFVGYLERKQYGSESMVERMFERRAEWSSQFGVHRRMGFWGFFQSQFGGGNAWFIVAVVLSVLGLWEMARRSPGQGSVFIILLLLATVGLILYMNFADGSRMDGGRDYLEVRDRDYFFTPGFMLIALAIGAGVTGLIQIIRESLQELPGVAKISAVTIVIAALAFPALAIAGNYRVSDRSGNYIPFDYAKNILASARKNAILVTAGDNDTFSIWALQSVYGYRTDVTNVNLSLANADWYIKELRDRHNVPLAISDKQIESLRPGRTAEGRFVRISEQVTDYLVATSASSPRPIDYSITVPPSGRRFRGKSLDNRLTIVGRTYQLRQDTSGFDYDAEKSADLINNEFGYRSLGVDGVHQDQVSAGMTNSYSNDFNRLINDYRRTRNTVGIRNTLSFAHNVLPDNKQIAGDYIESLSDAGMTDGIPDVIRSARQEQRPNMIKSWARAARRGQRTQEAVDALKLGIEIYPDDKEMFYGLIALQQEAKRFSAMLPYLQNWIERNPNDTTAVRMFNQLNSAFQPKPIDTSTGTDSN